MSRDFCPEESSHCIYYNTPSGCFSDVHHTFGQARAKALGHIARVFGELEQNKEQICRAEHDEIHAANYYPEFPSVTVMLQAIEDSRYNRGK